MARSLFFVTLLLSTWSGTCLTNALSITDLFRGNAGSNLAVHNAKTMFVVSGTQDHHHNRTRRDDPPQAPPPPYVWQDFMYFEDSFPSKEHEYTVIAALIDTLRLAAASVKAIDKMSEDETSVPGTVSSFLRYFSGIDLASVRAVMTNVLVVLGVTEAEEQCRLLPRLPILYDDTWKLARHCLNKPDLRAYMVSGDEPSESFLNVCPYFFKNFRRIDQISCSSLGQAAENGFPGQGGMWSSGSTLLHDKSFLGTPPSPRLMK